MKIEDYENLGLLFECPFRKSHSDCPFNEMRNLKLKEKIQYFNTISNKDLDFMNEYHSSCMRKRETKNLIVAKQISGGK